MIQRLQYERLRPALEAIKPEWDQLMQGRDGFFLEDKGWTLALHARFASEAEAEQVLPRAREVVNAASFAQEFRILGGHRFLEIAPRLASKRETVAYLLSHYSLPDARLLYIGDDDKDEEAFPLIHAHGGIAVKVFQPSQSALSTTADFSLASPAETRAWLQELL